MHADRFMPALQAFLIGGIFSRPKKINICMHNIV